MSRHRYTPEEIQFIKDNAAGRTYFELAELFNRRFNAAVNGGNIGSAFCFYDSSRRFKRHRYTPEEIQFLKDNVNGRSYFELKETFNRRFNLSVAIESIEYILGAHKLKNNGNNKLSGMEYLKYKQFPLGSERKFNGFICVKIAHNPFVWKKKHVFIWEKANGPVPKGHVVIFADGNRLNFDPDNLILVSRGELAVINRKHLIFPDADLTKTGILIAKTIMLVNKRKKETR
jgi:hypothetical protein